MREIEEMLWERKSSQTGSSAGMHTYPEARDGFIAWRFWSFGQMGGGLKNYGLAGGWLGLH